MLTLADLKQRLKSVNEVDLLEILDIASEDIVDRFGDLIEDKYDELLPDFEDETEEGPY